MSWIQSAARLRCWMYITEPGKPSGIFSRGGNEYGECSVASVERGNRDS